MNDLSHPSPPSSLEIQYRPRTLPRSTVGRRSCTRMGARDPRRRTGGLRTGHQRGKFSPVRSDRALPFGTGSLKSSSLKGGNTQNRPDLTSGSFHLSANSRYEGHEIHRSQWLCSQGGDVSALLPRRHMAAGHPSGRPGRLCKTTGVPEPIVFMDNGFSSRVPRPALGSLVSSVESGVYDVVLVVGLFAFSLDGCSACEVVQRLQGAGCKVVEIPSPTRRSRLIPVLPESGPARREWVGWPDNLRTRRTTPLSTSPGSAAGVSSRGSHARASSPVSGSAATAGRSSGRSPGCSATPAHRPI